MNASETVAGYIAAQPLKVRKILRTIRATVRRAAPHADEKISYRMPAFFQGGVLIYYGAFKNHIGIFPPIRGDRRLERILAPYANAKGNLRFPLDEPVPYNLITRIVRLRVEQNAARPRPTRTAR